MRPKLISITRRYFRLSSSSISSSSCIFHSRNHASSAPLFENTSSGNSISSEYNKGVTFKPFSSPSNPSYYVELFNSLIGAQPIINDSGLECWDEDGGPMTDFLIIFASIMKGELFIAYPGIDKETINAMLLIIISELEKGGLAEMLDSTFVPSRNFNQGLWETVWGVCNSVFRIMILDKRNFKKNQETPPILTSYVGGLRGATLREMIFKWKIRGIPKFEFEYEEEEEATKAAGETVENDNVEEKKKKPEVVKYNIYGLDLSEPKFVEIIDRIHEADKLISTPGEPPKEITGKCKMVHEKILSLKTTDQGEDLLSSLLAEWTEILQPNRIDWLILLDNIKQRNLGLYFKMAEHVLDEDSFQANSRDYLKLMHAHTKDNRLDDADRILRKMTDKGGIQPDILTSTILLQMYSKTNNVECAKAAFDEIMTRGFPPDYRTNKYMIMTLLNATQRIITKVRFFAHMQPDLESCTLLVDAQGQAAGDPEQARRTIDNMIGMGYGPDDRCTSSMPAAYGNKIFLDKALIIFLKLEKYGVVTGPSVYSDMIDWCRELELVVDEELLRKVNEKGDTPPLKAM